MGQPECRWMAALAGRQHATPFTRSPQQHRSKCFIKLFVTIKLPTQNLNQPTALFTFPRIGMWDHTAKRDGNLAQSSYRCRSRAPPVAKDATNLVLYCLGLHPHHMLIHPSSSLHFRVIKLNAVCVFKYLVSLL